MASYLETAAKEKLKLYEQQLYQNAGSDAALSRNLKELKAKDFKQQIQPIRAKVNFYAGQVSGISTPKRWGRIVGAKRDAAGRGGPGALTSQQKTQARLEKKARAASQATKVINTGAMEIVAPELKWTTEGYTDTGKTPESQGNIRIVRKGIEMYANFAKKANITKRTWKAGDQDPKYKNKRIAQRRERVNEQLSLLPIAEARRVMEQTSQYNIQSFGETQGGDLRVSVK